MSHTDSVLETTSAELTAIVLLNKDLKDAINRMNPREVRYLVDFYYQLQKYRIAADGQVRAIEQNENKEPAAVLNWMTKNIAVLENQAKAALGNWAKKRELGVWMQSIYGIGPVFSAGLIAYLDFSKSDTAGGFWRYMGYDPTREWIGRAGAEDLVKTICESTGKKPATEAQLIALCAACHITRGTLTDMLRRVNCEEPAPPLNKLVLALSRCPWNMALKRLGFLIGDSFIKFRNADKDMYGHFYDERKQVEWTINLAGGYANQAREKVQKNSLKADYSKNWYSGKLSPTLVKVALNSGDPQAMLGLSPSNEGDEVAMLPPAHIHARARRWMVKIFISHVHLVGYWCQYKRMPPKPFALAHLEHKDMFHPPNMHLVQGLEDAYADTYPDYYRQQKAA